MQKVYSEGKGEGKNLNKKIPFIKFTISVGALMLQPSPLTLLPHVWVTE